MMRVLTGQELKQLAELRVAAEKRPITQAEQDAMNTGRVRASDVVKTILKLKDNLWISLTLEEHDAEREGEEASRCFHASVSIRGLVPSDELLRAIAAALKLEFYAFSDDPRHGAFVRHIIAGDVPESVPWSSDA